MTMPATATTDDDNDDDDDDADNHDDNKYTIKTKPTKTRLM